MCNYSREIDFIKKKNTLQVNVVKLPGEFKELNVQPFFFFFGVSNSYSEKYARCGYSLFSKGGPLGTLLVTMTAHLNY